MIYQTDKALRREIRLWGCNFMSHIYMVEPNADVDRIEYLYQKALRKGVIDANCTMRKPQEFLQDVMGSEIWQRGGHDSQGATWGVDKSDPRIKYVMVRWSQYGSQNQHFTIFAPDFETELYDPHCAEEIGYEIKKDKIIGYAYYF